MDLGLKDKTIFVSGSSSGIGRATAECLALEGARVVLHGHRNVGALADWLAQQSWRERARIARADVSDPEAMGAAMGEAARFAGRAEDQAEDQVGGRIHGCVINAGIWPPDDTPLVDLDPERIRRVFDVNVLGAFWTAQAFLRALRSAGPDPGGEGASIVFTGSTAAKFGERGHSDYAASKSALSGLMRSLKNEIVALDPYGRVNVVDPGWTVTEMTKDSLDAPGTIERVVRTMPVQQLANADDIARAITWLLSPVGARHVSGETLTVAGGMEGRVLWEEDDVDAGAVRRRLGL